MQKLVIALWVILHTLSMLSNAQGCHLKMKDGSKLTLNVNSFSNLLVYDPKFLKLKEEKQDEQIVAYNERVNSGAEKPTVTALSYTVKKESTKDGDEYTLSVNISGKTYSSYIICRDDTLFIARNRGIIEVPDGKGGIYGYTIQGIQKLPLKIKVGDELPTFEDISIITPTTTDITVAKKVFSHNSKSTTNEFGFFTDSYTGESGLGAYTKTSTKAVYKSIDVNVRKTLNSSAHFLHYVNARVSGEEKINIGGVEYNAFIIESESWSKMKMENSYETADEAIANQLRNNDKKIENKIQKLMLKKGFTNPLGYTVIFKKEWFVPELGGMVKVEVYDQKGGITSISTLKSIE